MGLYCYTLRKETRKISGKIIGRMSYAYKDHWGAASDPKIMRKHEKATEAAFLNPDLEYVIMADSFKDAIGEPIFKKNKTCCMTWETPKLLNEQGNYETVVVGYLQKKGRSYYISDTPNG